MDLAGITWIESLHLAESQKRASRAKTCFLDLATETRIQIYKYLLINRSPSGGELEVVHIVDRLQRRQGGYSPYSRYSSGNGKGLIPARGARNSARHIHTAILQTCKKIADEGSYFMYSNNVFGINLSRESFAPGYRYFRETDQHLIQPIANLFSTKQESPAFLSELSYVSFFQTVGARNTATIAHLQIFGNSTTEYEITMPVLTEVLKTHLPQLETTIFYLIADPVDQRSYGREDSKGCIAHPEPTREPNEEFRSRSRYEGAFDPGLPQRATDPCHQLYAALDDFSQKLVDLESLEFRGHWKHVQQECLGVGLDGRWAMMITDRIAAYVRERTRQQRVALGLASDKDVEQPPAANGRLLRWRDYEEEGQLSRKIRSSCRAGVDDCSSSNLS
ncbi:hypothetical protein BP6252_12751 [Coleophoma cylindrospora]|uniref:Uncharacterized protein n=1 Tax=Coleophoma cylindrospora TaxID=1849047 RepID=A0A3D8QE07_9HELO|nr:hypothetical protein BP6252_12751 [Coleophoma cylindrospora]